MLLFSTSCVKIAVTYCRTVALGKAKLASKRRIGDSEVTEPSQSSSAANGDNSIEGRCCGLLGFEYLCTCGAVVWNIYNQTLFV